MKKDPSDEKAERDLMALYAQREELVKNLKFAPGDRVAAGQALLRKIDAEIEMREATDAEIQQKQNELEEALTARRQGRIDRLATLNERDADPNLPLTFRTELIKSRTAILEFLQQDAAKRGIADDDH